MTLEYQNDDADAYDYSLYPFGNLHLRGPQPDINSGNYFACIGAAQTFGRYVDTPFPSILSKQLSLDCMNLGVGGAGPRVFLNPAILQAINNSRFAIVQVLSGRSSSNTFFDAGGVAVKVKRPGLTFASPDAKRSTLGLKFNSQFSAETDNPSQEIPVGTSMHAGQAYDALLRNFDRNVCDTLRQETKLRHALMTIQLLKEITVPKVLFYFSEREPSVINREYNSFQQYFGDFPHFVDQEFVDLVSPHADHFVKCVSHRGKPHKLSRPLQIKTPTGSMIPLEMNRYYPSPEMHEDAANSLIDIVRAMTR